MPELPEVEALASFLRERALGRAVVGVDVASFSALKSFDPPLSVLPGLVVSGASRHGKFLSLDFDGDSPDGLHLITHLSRAGWLHWRDALPPAPPKPGRGPIAVRVHLSPDDPPADSPADSPAEPAAGPAAAAPGFDLTEAGTQKRLAVYLVHDPFEVSGIARLGPDALAVDVDGFAALLAGHRGQLKGTLTDQTLIAGIGNAYSDEILHTARLSPFKIANTLTADEAVRLHEAMRQVLTGAVARSVGQRAASLKGEKRGGLRVHARGGLPCPVCGTAIGSVSFAERSFQYCPTCQTGGRPLADRRLSKLIK